VERLAAAMRLEVWHYWGNERTGTADNMYGPFSLKTLFEWLAVRTLDADARVRHVVSDTDAFIDVDTALRSVLLRAPGSPPPPPPASIPTQQPEPEPACELSPPDDDAAAAATSLPLQEVRRALFESVMKSLKGFLLGKVLHDCLSEALPSAASPAKPRAASLAVPRTCSGDRAALAPPVAASPAAAAAAGDDDAATVVCVDHEAGGGAPTAAASLEVSFAG
jgi:septal ring-binding cell division protein DamX